MVYVCPAQTQVIHLDRGYSSLQRQASALSICVELAGAHLEVVVASDARSLGGHALVLAPCSPFC